MCVLGAGSPILSLLVQARATPPISSISVHILSNLCSGVSDVLSQESSAMLLRLDLSSSPWTPLAPLAAHPFYFMFCFSNASVSEVDGVSQGSFELTSQVAGSSYAPGANINHSPSWGLSSCSLWFCLSTQHMM